MRLPNKLLLFLFLLSRSNTYQLESGSEKKAHVFVEKTKKLFWKKNLERLYRRRICNRAENFAHPFTTSKLLERI